MAALLFLLFFLARSLTVHPLDAVQERRRDSVPGYLVHMCLPEPEGRSPARQLLVTGTGCGATGFMHHALSAFFREPVCGERPSVNDTRGCNLTVAWTARCTQLTGAAKKYHLIQQHLYSVVIQLVRDPLSVASSYRAFCPRSEFNTGVWTFIYDQTPYLHRNELEWFFVLGQASVPCVFRALAHWTTWHEQIERVADARVLAETMRLADLWAICGLLNERGSYARDCDQLFSRAAPLPLPGVVRHHHRRTQWTWTSVGDMITYSVDRVAKNKQKEYVSLCQHFALQARYRAVRYGYRFTS